MAREKFVARDFKDGSLDVIEKAAAIIEDYQAQGFTLTLRQLYYQFVAHDSFPPERRFRSVGNDKWVRDPKGTPNATPNYKWLASIINDARLAGLIDWYAIEDRTRGVETVNTWDSPDKLVEAGAAQYKEDLWADQKYRPEIWIEKDALTGIIEPACTKYRVPSYACRGYSSQSEQYRAGKRFERQLAKGLIPVVIHLGDHDPSGIDMTRDNADRLEMFAYERVELRRIALNMDQIEQYNPPPNPAKESDSRSTGYIEKFGDSSWELDALDPRVIDRLISRELDTLIDKNKWKTAKAGEEERRDFLQRVSDNWEDVTEFLRGLE